MDQFVLRVLQLSVAVSSAHGETSKGMKQVENEDADLSIRDGGRGS